MSKQTYEAVYSSWQREPEAFWAEAAQAVSWYKTWDKVLDSSKAEIVGEVVQLVREEIGPVASLKTAVVVERLPKTRSGKVLRGTMKRIADRQEWRMPATIDDPAILDEIMDSLADVGYGPDAE